ncbi:MULTISPECIES: hypothetical protein [Streptomyces]|uniref:GDSL-like Lipase/Acylhydrolase family protein n=1 Tax=Streptomyces lonegramiae TaxID=3075524 RepID=A0ABU2XCW1_9ACTN|nr:hypothetical protein [Streptomyces sp. DSM 41529]MDT0543741.1 hypothetical protein [Streptomyces sp. DSM 41529]
MEEFEASYDRLLAPLAEAGTKLILIEPFLTLARKYGAQLLAADRMFAKLAATTGPEYWAADGVHPTPAGHAALAAAWLRLVA